MILGIISSQQSGPVQIIVATSGGVTIPGSATVDEELEGTYTYVGTADEQNIPPSIEDCFISGTMVVGETITFNVTNHRVYNDGSAAPTVFRLYSASDQQQTTEALLYTGTNTTFVLTGSELSKYLRVEADPKQTGGANLTGATVKSAYTSIVLAAP